MKNEITGAVKLGYGAVATSGLSGENRGVEAIALAFGYSPGELASIPAGSNLGLSCGNPTALASLRAGETVVDLGSGGGLDVFLASQKVGPGGKAIGIDMTPEMVALARRNASLHSASGDYSNVEFILAEIDNIPLDDNSVDCVISNCVINLSADKQAVFREIARIVKPGGRLAISDIALKKSLPAELKDDIGALVGCISGAISFDKFRDGLREAGFESVQVIDSNSDLNAYASVENQSGCCSPAMGSSGLPVLDGGCCGTGSEGPAETNSDLHATLSGLLGRYDINEFAASVKVLAVKP